MEWQSAHLAIRVARTSGGTGECSMIGAGPRFAAYRAASPKGCARPSSSEVGQGNCAANGRGPNPSHASLRQRGIDDRQVAVPRDVFDFGDAQNALQLPAGTTIGPAFGA